MLSWHPDNPAAGRLRDKISPSLISGWHAQDCQALRGPQHRPGVRYCTCRVRAWGSVCAVATPPAIRPVSPCHPRDGSRLGALSHCFSGRLGLFIQGLQVGFLHEVTHWFLYGLASLAFKVIVLISERIIIGLVIPEGYLASNSTY